MVFIRWCLLNITGHDNMEFGLGHEGQYYRHCHSTDQLNQQQKYHFQRNGFQRASMINVEEKNSKYEKFRYNTLRSSGFPCATNLSYPNPKSIKNGYTPWPIYATVQVRQNKKRSSIFPPGVKNCNAADIEGTTGGTIRRYASVQLRSKQGSSSSKGRIIQNLTVSLLKGVQSIFLKYSIHLVIIFWSELVSRLMSFILFIYSKHKRLLLTYFYLVDLTHVE